MTGHKYTELVAECLQHDCTANVWTFEGSNGKRYRVQTPYCERHASEFSSARMRDPEAHAL